MPFHSEKIVEKNCIETWKHFFSEYAERQDLNLFPDKILVLT